MKIAICGSMTSVKKMIEVKNDLHKLGHEVILPKFTENYAQMDNLDKVHSESVRNKIKHDLIRRYFKEIEKVDAVLITNNEEKHGIKNYIGGNSFLEMSFAHVLNKDIFLLNPIPEIFYKDEIIALQPVVIGTDWSKLYHTATPQKSENKIKEYQELCKRSAKKIENPKEEIYTWGLGIAGEAGDIASCIKKTFAHDNDQRAGIRENIGDTFWYTAMICNYFNWDLGEILDENTEKLRKRYPAGFTTKDAGRGGTMVDWGKR